MYALMWLMISLWGCAEEKNLPTSLPLYNGNADSLTTSNNDGLTFYRDIQPILEQHCVSCHQDGGQGVGDFTDPQTVQQMAVLIHEAVESDKMPPPVADPECRDYYGSDVIYLSEDKKELIAKWVDEGHQLGNESNKQEYERNHFELENADLIIQIPEPYTPAFDDANNPGNEYRCFSIQHGRDEPFYITGMHPIIDQPGIVHHIVLAKADPQGIIHGSDQPNGASCIHNSGSFIRDFEHGMMLSGWAPGMKPVVLEDGVGMMIQPNDYIVIQMHYSQNPELGDVPDQTAYTFTTSDVAEHTTIMLPLGIHNFVIPAGAEDYTATGQHSLPLSFRIWGVFPHMHVLGSGYEFSVEHLDGEKECIARADTYDFNNQFNYIFKKEVKVDANSQINISCTWNNSVDNPNLIHNPPVDIRYGERTDEEMCYAFSLVSFD